jgi:hypothetical protein
MKSTYCFKKYSNSSTFKIEAKELDYLYIQESQIPGSGKGLFTAIPIYKDEVISIFKGEILSDIEAQYRVTDGEDGYFINMPDGTILDSMKVKCFAKYANDVLGVVETTYKNNSKITLDENGAVCLVANRKILAAEEIFCGYGNGYWKKYRSQSGLPSSQPLMGNRPQRRHRPDNSDAEDQTTNRLG